MPATELLLQGATQVSSSLSANYTAGGGIMTLPAALTDHGGTPIPATFEVLVGRNRPLTERRYFTVIPTANTLAVTPSPGYVDNQSFIIGDLVDVISAWETQRRLRAFATLHTHTGAVDGSAVGMGAVSSLALGQANVDGTGTTPSHSDHKHALPIPAVSTPGVLVTDATSALWIPYGRPTNLIYNGHFQFAQTGASLAAVPDGGSVLDTWRWSTVGTGVATIDQVAGGGPAYNGTTNLLTAPNCMRVTVTTADTSIAASDLYLIVGFTEGPDFQRASGLDVSFSFWVRAHRTGVYCVVLLSGNTTQSYVHEYTISVADTWEYKTFTIPASSNLAQYAAAAGNYGFRYYFTLAGGSTFQGANDAWTAGIKFSTANQVNGVGATSDVFSVANVNVVPGSIPYPLWPLDFTLEQRKVMRYRQVIVPGANQAVAAGHCLSTTRFFVTRPLAVEMGGTPTITFSAVGDFSAYNQGTAIICTTIADFVSNSRTLWLDCSVAAGLAAGDGTMMYGNTGASRLRVDWYPV